MAVTVAATGFVQDSGGSNVTLFNFNNITVPAGATALLCVLQTASLTANANTLSATWDSGGTNQSMTSVSFKASGSTTSHDSVTLFGLLNPTAGAKTLQCSWSNACTCCVAAIAFNGTITSSLGACFINQIQASANATSAALNVTSPSGDYAVAALTWNSISTMTPTAWWTDGNGVAFGGAHYQAGSGTAAFSATSGAASALYGYAGIDVAAAPTGGGPVYDVVGVGSTEW